MTLNYNDLISRRIDDRPFRYTDMQIMLYNLSIGMGRNPSDAHELPFVFEHPALQVVPTAGTAIDAEWQNILDGADIDWSHVLHGGQRLTLHRPLPPAADLLCNFSVSEATDKGAGKGATVTVRSDVRLLGGEPLYCTEYVIFARANGGFGGTAKSAALPHPLPERLPDIVHVTQTRPDQALLYRLNGDRNPLHAEPEFARRAGFPAPILHGMCSYGIACRAVLASVCGYDPARIRQFDARFTAPVFPGETIRTEIWIDGDLISFRSIVEERQITSLNNGRCILGA